MKTNHHTIPFTWKHIDTLVKHLVRSVKNTSVEYDVIVGVLRGGMVPAVILSHSLNIRTIIPISSIRTLDDSVNASKHEPYIYADQKEIQRLKGKRILLVDDILGSGQTLSEVRHLLQKHHPQLITSVVLVTNLDNLTNSSNKADMCGKEVRGWVIFPWE